MNEIELGLKNSIWDFTGETFDNDINESVSSHFPVLDHFEKASPDQGPAENVSDIMQVLLEVGQRYFINNVLGKSVILEVQ